MPDKTIAEAAKELKLLVRELKFYFDGEYQKVATSRRMFRVAVISILVSMVSSFIFTVSTISTCFLGTDDPYFWCSTMPGYNDAVKNNKQLLEEFRELQKRSKANERRLEQLEKRNG